MEIKSERNIKRAKFKFELCELMFGLGLEVTEAYDGIY
jgi:hypothetical protein